MSTAHPHHHHHHHHHAHAEPSGHKTVGDHNEEHFDTVGHSVFNEEWVQKVMAQVTTELQTNFSWFGVSSSALMLDYACGNGLVTKALSPYLTNIHGMDLSTTMVTEYNSLQIHRATKTDLTVSPSSTLYDLIVISLALHHIESPQGLITNLARSLQPNGVLVVVDWTDEHVDLTTMPLKHIVSRSGFSEHEMLAMFADAGLTDGEYKLFKEESSVPGGKKRGFLARGQLKH